MMALCHCGATYSDGDWCKCEDNLVRCTRCGDLHEELDEGGDIVDLCERCVAWQRAVDEDRRDAWAEDKWDEQRDLRRTPA